MAVKRQAPDDVVVTGYELMGAADPALARRAVERMSQAPLDPALSTKRIPS